jgi:hypothetical protein
MKIWKAGIGMLLTRLAFFGDIGDENEHGGDALRKFVTAFLFGLFVIVAAGAKPAQAQNGVATFTFTNNASNSILIKMHSQSRSWTWPSPTSHYTLDDTAPHSIRIACNVGEKVCYGGSYTENDTPKSWGVGFRGNKACTGCCLTCGAPGQNVNHHWRLTD